MEFAAFHEWFPKLGKDECRSVILPDGGESIPPGEYAFVECYCADKDCDCRRVMLMVIDSRTGKPMASIAYGFDRKAPLAGPFLDPLHPQSVHASEFLDLAKEMVLLDGHYTARLEKHYRMFKAAQRGDATIAGAMLSPAQVQERIAARKARKQLVRQLKQRTKRSRRIGC